MLSETYAFLERHTYEPIHNRTGRQVDFDFSGTLEEVLERVRPVEPKKGPGRPRLGVKSAEISLLPRHWEWLQRRPRRRRRGRSGGWSKRP